MLLFLSPKSTMTLMSETLTNYRDNSESPINLRKMSFWTVGRKNVEEIKKGLLSDWEPNVGPSHGSNTKPEKNLKNSLFEKTKKLCCSWYPIQNTLLS